MAATELIKWAGRTLNGSDRFGEWVTTEIEGWWDSPDVKGETVDRPNADGEYDLPLYNQARLLTITGGLHTDGHAQTHHAMNWLTGAMKGRIQVHGHGTTQWADAKRNGGVKFTPITDTFAQWQVRLKCVNPLKFGELNTFPLIRDAFADVYHRGNCGGSALVTVTGNAPGGYTLSEPGGVYYEVTGPLNPGQTHTIDFKTGIFRINGYIIAGQTGVSDIWFIEPGAGQPMKITSAGTVYAKATVLDTYI